MQWNNQFSLENQEAKQIVQDIDAIDIRFYLYYLSIYFLDYSLVESTVVNCVEQIFGKDLCIESEYKKYN